MDAMIMHGDDLNAGAVVGVSRVKNPVSLARIIMEKTPHAMFAGQGAHRVAKSFGISLVEPRSLVTSAAVEEWKEYKKYNRTVGELFCSKDDALCHDTVGACAMDSNGHFASATSTGGITAKRAGRVGDSPIVCSGGYADNRLGAVSTTGHGTCRVRSSARIDAQSRLILPHFSLSQVSLFCVLVWHCAHFTRWTCRPKLSRHQSR